MKRKLIFFSLITILLAIVGFVDPYSRRIRPFTSVPSACAENEIGYSMTLHKPYICTNAGYKELLSSVTAAPIDATFITETSNSSLTNEFALASLATGILKNTTTTGIPSIAVAGTDYQVPITAGDVTTSGATSTIGATKVTNAMLAGSIAYSKLTLTNSIVSGDIVSLVWSKITSTPTTFAGYSISDTSANFLTAISDETGSGLIMGNSAPTILNPIITNISPGANFTLTQNSVASLTSVESGAIVNTLYLKAGKIGMGNTNPAFPLVINRDGSVGSGNWVNIAQITDATPNKGISIGYDSTSQTGLIVSETASTASKLAFWTYSGSAWGERFGITSTGITINAATLYNSGTPSIAGNATLNTGSKDSAGKITSTGTGASTAVLTFANAFTRAPACFVTNETTSNLVRPVSTTTTLTINATVVNGDSISYICNGY